MPPRLRLVSKIYSQTSIKKTEQGQAIEHTLILEGGAEGLVVEVKVPNPNFGFLSTGFNIWKEHSNVSSTLIMEAALSNSPQ